MEIYARTTTHTGQRLDPESGLYHFHFRQYDADAGVWTTPDPIGILGGLNLYQYVKNNPLKWIDPLGLEDADATGGMAGDFGGDKDIDGDGTISASEKEYNDHHYGGNESFTDDGLGLGPEESLDDTGPGDPDMQDRIDKDYDGHMSEYNLAKAEKERDDEYGTNDNFSIRTFLGVTMQSIGTLRIAIGGWMVKLGITELSEGFILGLHTMAAGEFL